MTLAAAALANDAANPTVMPLTGLMIPGSACTRQSHSKSQRAPTLSADRLRKATDSPGQSHNGHSQATSTDAGVVTITKAPPALQASSNLAFAPVSYPNLTETHAEDA